MKNNLILFLISIFILVGCGAEPGKKEKESIKDKKKVENILPEKTRPSLSTILSKSEVPVLCYHHIRNFRANESNSMKSYSVTPAAFAAQMKILSDSGYQTILPGQLYEYLLFDAVLPPKPVMISFDDTDGEQYTIAKPEMDKYGFKGVYFIMTIAMNRPRYMRKEQIKNLSDSGHVIAAHTWDHHKVTQYAGADWDTQFVKPKAQLETITGKPVQYFAYPFGLWNTAAIPELKKSGYDLAFILSTKRDSTEPLHTIRRMIVPGTWSANGMLKAMKSTFNK